MTRHVGRCLVGVILVVTLAGCGVTLQRRPVPILPPAPAILPPTVTQQVAPAPSATPVTPRGFRLDA